MRRKIRRVYQAVLEGGGEGGRGSEMLCTLYWTMQHLGPLLVSHSVDARVTDGVPKIEAGVTSEAYCIEGSPEAYGRCISVVVPSGSPKGG